MASPSVTQNAYGNVANVQSLAANTTTAALVIDATTKFEVQIQIDLLTGATAQASVSSTVKVYRDFGSGPTQDTVPITQLSIAMGAINTHYIASLALPTGKYAITVTNGDTANAITYSITTSTVDSIA